ncbi:hypothetical protein D9619_004585 [Psilocybe cf. subviscida]|uniref:Uncharacterized protein n=1 Tax=Psilocybe cf. subviscida TaxID=2480587 RepID=A0A8H5BRH7_9AGAR|nr:hypothetical protein D9619_004585 [Psilocybe cf. subviscida]
MIRLLALVAAFLLLVDAQVTTTVVINGATVVQVVGTDAQGNPFTQPIATVPSGAPQPGTPAAPPPNVPTTGPPPNAAPTSTPTPTSTSSPTTPSTTSPISLNTDTGIQGPVGAPASTSGTPGAPIPYVYTTVIGRVTTVIQDIFTPTSPATVSVTASGSGTILDFSDWLTMNGLSPTNTVLPGAGSSLRPMMIGFILPVITAVCWLLSTV